MIWAEIFDAPRRRSVKVMGISRMRAPRRQNIMRKLNHQAYPVGRTASNGTRERKSARIAENPAVQSRIGSPVIKRTYRFPPHESSRRQGLQFSILPPGT